MNIQKLRPIVVLLISCCAVYSLAAEEPNECAWIDGTFRVVDSNTVVVWDDPVDDCSLPKFCASIILRNSNLDSIVDEMRQTDEWSTLSESQVEFSKHHSFYQHRGSSRGLYKGYQNWYLYGVTKADAEKLARVFLRVKASRVHERRTEREESLKLNQEALTQAQTQLPIKQAELMALEQQFNKIKTNARYMSLTEADAKEAAKQSILRMNTLLDEIAIEKVGVESRIHAIQQYLQKGVCQELEVQFEGQMIQQTIELTALEARNQSVLEVLKQQNSFLSLSEEFFNLRYRVQNLENEVWEKQTWIERSQNVLNSSPRSFMPHLADNQVTIHPVISPFHQ